MKKCYVGIAAMVLSVITPTLAIARSSDRVAVIVDSDIGTTIDDAFALAAIIASERYELLAVTTSAQQADVRARIICRFLTSMDIRNVPIAFGRGEQAKAQIDWQSQYARHASVVWGRTVKPDKDVAEDLMARVLAARDSEHKTTILALGPLTNVARLLEKNPASKAKIDRIVLAEERVVRSDIAAAKVVFRSGVPLVVVSRDATANLTISSKQLQRLFAVQTPLTLELQSLYELWETKDSSPPMLCDVVAARLGYDEEFAQAKRLKLEVTEAGEIRTIEGEPNALVATHIDAERFSNDYVSQVTAFGKPIPFVPPQNHAPLVERGGLPKVVHAFEDFDNDIERRWWMAGKLETQELPVGSRRAQRATITQDFDDLQGDARARYRAVVFNPVPGPPVGAKTHLAFRYKLIGTDTLRVQIFSLSNGYHRYLSLAGLPQGTWQEATVDMTQMRRPDGSGGPLSKDERIDDIQFYIDPRAELIVDSLILYEPADEYEKQPFPQRILFTGWFDTGRQGVEWPGSFEIVAHEKPRTWDAAKSVIDQVSGRSWIRLSLRGERRLAPRTKLRCDYRLQGADEFTIKLRNSRTKQETSAIAVASPPKSEWTQAIVTFDVAPFADFKYVDEIQFETPEGAVLFIDNVLLFEPGSP